VVSIVCTGRVTAGERSHRARAPGRTTVYLANEAGRRQARRLGAVLGSQDLTAIFTSPLLGAAQTAAAVSDRAGLPAITDERLADQAPGLESGSIVRKRAVAGLTDIARRFCGGTVVVVSHDAVNRQVLTALDPNLGEPGRLPQETGCFNTLELRDGSWTVQTVNEIPSQAP
jgi:broad specificity phosphatase PhoE